MASHKLSLLIFVTAATAVPQFPVLYAPPAAFFMPLPPPPPPLPMPVGVPIPVPIPVPIIKPKVVCAPTTTKCPPCPCKPKAPPFTCDCKCLYPIPAIPSNPSGVIASYIPQYIPSYIPPQKWPHKRPYKRKRLKYICRSSSSEISSDTDDSDCDSDSLQKWRKRRRKRRRKKKKYGILRRNGRRINSNNDNQILTPVLSYVSENGDVKFRKRISKENAASLLRKLETPNKFDHKSRIHTNVW